MSPSTGHQRTRRGAADNDQHHVSGLDGKPLRPGAGSSLGARPSSSSRSIRAALPRSRPFHRARVLPEFDDPSGPHAEPLVAGPRQPADFVGALVGEQPSRVVDHGLGQPVLDEIQPHRRNGRRVRSTRVARSEGDNRANVIGSEALSTDSASRASYVHGARASIDRRLTSTHVTSMPWDPLRCVQWRWRSSDE